MAGVKHDHSFRWYFLFSFFALLIVIGTFTAGYHYLQSVSVEVPESSSRETLTFNTVGASQFSGASKPDLKGPFVLVLVGIAGFLFTKFTYESHIGYNKESGKWH